MKKHIAAKELKQMYPRIWARIRNSVFDDFRLQKKILGIKEIPKRLALNIAHNAACWACLEIHKTKDYA